MSAPVRIIVGTPPAGALIPDDVLGTLRLLACLRARDIARIGRRQVDASRAAAVAEFRAALLDGGASAREAAAASAVFGDTLAAECRRLAADHAMGGAA